MEADPRGGEGRDEFIMGETIDDVATMAYLSGLFDGEGGINVSRRKGTKSFKLKVSVEMTGKMSQELLHRLFGGTLRERHNPRPNHRPTLSWNLDGRRAKGFLEAALPYLRIKKPEAIEALVFIAHLGQKGRGLPPGFHERQEEAYHRLRELKGRGYVRPDAVSPNTVTEVK